MICEFCGTEHGGGIQALVGCRDALKSQLASMTKRAEELEIQHTRDQLTIGLWRGRHEVAEAKLSTAEAVILKIVAVVVAQRDEARAKLATAEKSLQFIAARDLSGDCGCGSAAAEALHALGTPPAKSLTEFQRALGIEPSKERGK